MVATSTALATHDRTRVAWYHLLRTLTYPCCAGTAPMLYVVCVGSGSQQGSRRVQRQGRRAPTAPSRQQRRCIIIILASTCFGRAFSGITSPMTILSPPGPAAYGKWNIACTSKMGRNTTIHPQRLILGYMGFRRLPTMPRPAERGSQAAAESYEDVQGSTKPYRLRKRGLDVMGC